MGPGRHMRFYTVLNSYCTSITHPDSQFVEASDSIEGYYLSVTPGFHNTYESNFL